MVPKDQPKEFIHSLLLAADSYKVVSCALQQPEQQRTLQVRYGPYREYPQGYFPSSISIMANEGTAQTMIAVNYKKIDVEAPVRFPFRIPDGYEAIVLN